MNPIFERTSIRRWRAQPVEEDKTEQLLRAAMASPSAMNARPWKFYAIENEEIKAQLAQISPYSHFAAAAPLMIAVVTDDSGPCPEYEQIDAGICIENILLEAVELGLGAVCLGVMPEEDRMEAAAKILQLGSHEHCAALIPVGYPESEPEAKDGWDPEKAVFLR